MATIVGYESRTNKETNESFFVMIVSAPTPHLSKDGKVSVVNRKASVSAHGFTAEQLQLFVGSPIAGSVVKEPCTPYEWTSPEGEAVTMDYHWKFQAEV